MYIIPSTANNGKEHSDWKSDCCIVLFPGQDVFSPVPIRTAHSGGYVVSCDIECRDDLLVVCIGNFS